MLEYTIENQDELTKSEFLSKAELNNLKTYSENQVKQYAQAYKVLMSKAELEELSQEESVQMKIFKAELESLKKTTVRNDKLEKEVVFYRTQDSIIKSEGIENDFKTLKDQERYQTIIKGFEDGFIDEDTLEKAVGHKYFKREPKPGGGFKYYYTEAEYKAKNDSSDKLKTSKELQSLSTEELNKRINSKDINVSREALREGTRRSRDKSGDKREAQYKKEKGGDKKESTKEGKSDFKEGDSVVNTKTNDVVTLKNKRVSTGSTYPKGETLYDYHDKDGNYKGTAPSSRFKNVSGKQSESKQEGKSKEASKVLQLMDQDEDANYSQALNKVVKETGVDKAKLEKELKKYI